MESLQSPYLKIEELISLVDEPNRSACIRILSDHHKLFESIQGSSHNHQAWPGGYIDHVHETMNLAVPLYNTLNSLRPLPFTLSDTLLVMFLHDIEKPWKYEQGDDGKLKIKESLQPKNVQHQFRAEKLKEYGIILSLEQENGLHYVEGEFADYRGDERVMHPLAALCHICDIVSARIFFDYPTEKDDPWKDTQRFRTQ